mgnify:CR=1 FL=1
MQITDILEFLRRPASGSDALRSKLAEVAEAIPGAEAEAAKRAAERARKLLSASDREIEAIEKAEANAKRAVDRIRAAYSELQRRLDEAERAEARAALDAERADAERVATDAAERVRREYAKAARTIAGLVDDLDCAERRVADVNEKLVAAGRLDDLLRPVESRAIPEPEHVLAGPYKLAAASLPPAPGFCGLGRAREQAIVAGFVSEVIG